jgi:hypothetical protein
VDEYSTSIASGGMIFKRMSEVFEGNTLWGDNEYKDWTDIE